MSEALRTSHYEMPDESIDDFRETPQPPEQYLRMIGWSFVTPAERVRPRDPNRMARFDPPARSIAEKREKVIDAAYYALELSTDLKPLAEAGELVEAAHHMRQMDRFSPEADRKIDEFLIATGVNQALYNAYEQYEQYSLSDLDQVRQLTKRITPANTGALKAIRTMAKENKESGWISQNIAKSSEFLLRIVIANEKGVQLPAPSPRLHSSN
jgi:Zn-dependent oligopeptidase